MGDEASGTMDDEWGKWEETMKEKMDDEMGGDDDDVGEVGDVVIIVGTEEPMSEASRMRRSRDDVEEALKDGSGGIEAERSMVEFIKKE